MFVVVGFFLLHSPTNLNITMQAKQGSDWMSQLIELKKRINKFMRRWRMAPGTFGRLALKDQNFVPDLEKGRSPTMRTVTRVEKFMESYDGRFM
jgi:hypothetical protein